MHCGFTVDMDVWSYTWNNVNLLPAKAYLAQIGHLDIPNSIKWFWDSCCQLKHKFFFWLLLIDKLDSRAMFIKGNSTFPLMTFGGRILKAR